MAAALVFAALAAWAGPYGPTSLDSAADAWVRANETGWLVWLADGPLDVIAQPGVVLVIAGAVAVVLYRLGRGPEAALLLVALAITGIGGTELKDVFGRERPVGNLDEAVNEAFPSGHARFSAFWTWLAAIVAAHRPRRPAVRRALIAGGLTLTLLAGLARVYLRAHWLTDVLAGWALSGLAFALAALVVAGVAGTRRRAPKTAPARRSSRRWS